MRKVRAWYTVGAAVVVGSGLWACNGILGIEDVAVVAADGGGGGGDAGGDVVALADGGAPDGIFTAAWFRFPEGEAFAARARIKELLAKRIATQPLSLPNAGSVFRNPPGDHAARLIESCGLKGFAIGGARVSEKHANFIVNPQGRARAADIEALIVHVRETVRARTGVDLEPEVRIVGVAA